MLPSLTEPYATALRESIDDIRQRYEPTGILVSGSIIRGAPHATSDLDIVVTHPHYWRQRTQRFFNTVPAEMFVNPPFALEQAMEREVTSGRPVMAHMLATGAIIHDTGDVVATLQNTARDILTGGPNRTPEQLVQHRYAIATGFEDAVDIAAIDPEMASTLVTEAVLSSIRLLFLSAGRWLPRQKVILGEFEKMSPGWGHVARASLAPLPVTTQIETATPLIRHAAGTTGFFAWESSPHDVSP